MENASVPPPAPEKKKGMPALAWVGIGCGTLLIIVVVVVAILIGNCSRKLTAWSEEMEKNPTKGAAEMVVRFNPDLDMVSQDDDAGQMTIRNNKTGEQMTLDYADIAEGRLTVTDGEGAVSTIGTGDAEQAPAWVPRLPDVESAASVFHRESADEITGVLNLKTTMSADAVEEYFKEAAEKAGMSSSGANRISMNNTETRTLEFKGSSKVLNVQMSTASGGNPLMVQVAYTEKK